MTPYKPMPLQPRFTPTQDTPHCNESNVGEVLGVVGAFTAVALICVVLRMYVRIWVSKFVGGDDYIMCVAMLMAIATFVGFTGEINYGVGRHEDCTPLSDVGLYWKWQFYHNIWVMFGLVFVKISMALFLMRLASKRIWKNLLWGIIAFLVCFALACAGTLIFACIPVSASWDFALRANPSTKCLSVATFSGIGLMNSIVNIATDFLFALLPIPIIVHLHVNTRTKISLACILGLGFIACAAGIVKARLQGTFLQSRDRLWHDSFNMWAMLELCLVRPLGKHRPAYSDWSVLVRLWNPVQWVPQLSYGALLPLGSHRASVPCPLLPTYT